MVEVVIGQEQVSGHVAQAQISVEQMRETVTVMQIAQEFSNVEATIVDLIFIHWQIAAMTQAQVTRQMTKNYMKQHSFDNPLKKSILFLTCPLCKLETPTKLLTDFIRIRDKYKNQTTFAIKDVIHKISNKIGFKSTD